SSPRPTRSVPLRICPTSPLPSPPHVGRLGWRLDWSEVQSHRDEPQQGRFAHATHYSGATAFSYLWRIRSPAGEESRGKESACASPWRPHNHEYTTASDTFSARVDVSNTLFFKSREGTRLLGRRGNAH